MFIENCLILTISPLVSAKEMRNPLLQNSQNGKETIFNKKQMNILFILDQTKLLKPGGQVACCRFQSEISHKFSLVGMQHGYPK